MRTLYDVIEVGMDKPHKVKVIDVLLGWKSACKLVTQRAEALRGKPHFFKAVPAGEYRDGQPFHF